MIPMILLSVFGAAILGGAIYRWRGGLTNRDGSQSLVAPRFVRLFVWAAPMAALIGWAVANPIIGGAVLIGMMGGASFGHAKWQDLSHMNGKWNTDVLGMAWSGWLMAGPIGMIAKPVAYMIGWYGYDRQWTYPMCPWLRWGTEVGEFLTGFFIYGLTTLLIMMAI